MGLGGRVNGSTYEHSKVGRNMIHSENWKAATVAGEQRMMERVAGMRTELGGGRGRSCSLEALLRIWGFKG